MARTIKHEGDTWRVVSIGAELDGKTFCHLASATRGSWHRNGFYPIQIGDWIPNEQIAAIKAANA